MPCRVKRAASMSTLTHSERLGRPALTSTAPFGSERICGSTDHISVGTSADHAPPLSAESVR